MKKLKLLIAAMFMAVTLGLPAKAVFAAAVELSQADFDAADCTAEAPTAKGITCFGSVGFYRLNPGTYKLSTNITLPDNYGLVVSGNGDLNLDLNSKTFAGNTPNLVDLKNGANSATITNGTITNNADFGNGIGFETNGSLSNITINATDSAVHVVNRDSDNDDVADAPSNVTLDAVTTKGKVSVSNSSNLVINSGTYTASANGVAVEAAYHSTGSLTINGGTFTSNLSGASAGMSLGGTVIISGGTFTSNGYSGFLDDGSTSITIMDGSFTGKTAGLALSGTTPPVTLSGGTYTATGTGDGVGAITIVGGTTDAFAGLLATNYAYTDATSAFFDDGWSGVAYLTNKSVDVYNTVTPTPDPDPTPSSDTDDSSSSSTVGSPDTGRATSDGGSASSSAITGIIAASMLGLIAYVAHRKLAKKEA